MLRALLLLFLAWIPLEAAQSAPLDDRAPLEQASSPDAASWRLSLDEDLPLAFGLAGYAVGEFPDDWDCESISAKLKQAQQKLKYLKKQLEEVQLKILYLQTVLQYTEPGTHEYQAIVQELNFQLTLKAALEQEIAQTKALIALYQLYLSLFCNVGA